MKTSPLAGKPPQPTMLVNVPRLVTPYFSNTPDPSVPAQRVAFGTWGHRGSWFENSFNEWHVLGMSQAICDYRKQQGIDGLLFLGIDTHALSEPAFASALEVLAANAVDVMLADKDEYTPTPAISHAILVYNRGRVVELYANGIDGAPSVRVEMQRVRQLVGAANGYAYRAEVSATHPATDYTARLIPRHDGAAVPLEESPILWQR